MISFPYETHDLRGDEVTAVVRNPAAVSAPVRVVTADRTAPDPPRCGPQWTVPTPVLSGLGQPDTAGHSIAIAY